MADFDAVRTRQSVVPWLLFFIAAACAGALLYYGRQHLDLKAARVAQLEVDLTTATSWGGQVEAQRKQLEQKVQVLADEKLALSAEKFELSKGLLHAEAELKQLKTTYDSLEQKLRAEINKGEIRLSQGGGRIQVDLVDKVLFDSGKADLSTRGQDVLTRLGAVLSTVEDKRIQVSGHTDDSPITLAELKEKFPTNWELSAARAVNVVRFLSEKGGVPPRRLFAAANGEYEPVAPNATPLGRAQNRRIEILLSPVLTKQDARAIAAAEKPAAKSSPPADKPAAKPPPPAKKPPPKPRK